LTRQTCAADILAILAPLCVLAAAVDPVDFTTPVSDLTMGPLIPGVAQVDLDSGVDVAANIISLVKKLPNWSFCDR